MGWTFPAGKSITGYEISPIKVPSAKTSSDVHTVIDISPIIALVPSIVDDYLEIFGIKKEVSQPSTLGETETPSPPSNFSTVLILVVCAIALFAFLILKGDAA